MSGEARVYVKASEAKREKQQTPQKAHAEGSLSHTSPYKHVIHLQSTVGNQAVQRLFKSGVLQSKLRIGQPNDVYEQEADRVTDQVMQMPDTEVDSRQSTVGICQVGGRQTVDGGLKGESLQMKPG